MNSKTILGLLLSGSLFMVSCKKELQPQESPAPAEVTADGTATVPSDPNAMQLNAQPAEAQQMQQPVPQPVATTAPGMNPPHGQPNHRCDIAVGAPLNSPAGKTPSAQPQAQPQPVSNVQPQTPQGAATITPAVTAPGMNPPHGQPGHRCEIAVGAPLPQS